MDDTKSEVLGEAPMLYRTVLLVFLPLLSLAVGCGSASGLVGAPKTTLSITNKITTLQAGQTYDFTIEIDHDQGAGFTLGLNGAGTLVKNGPNASYVAPTVVPNPNSVTVTATAANGSGVSDSDTFAITAASGPVVGISPGLFTVNAGGASVLLNVSVTQDNPMDVLMGGVDGSPDCGGPCGSLGAFSGTPGGGTYTVPYSPPASVTTSTQQRITVISNLAGQPRGTAYVIINP